MGAGGESKNIRRTYGYQTKILPSTLLLVKYMNESSEGTADLGAYEIVSGTLDAHPKSELSKRATASTFS